MDGNKVVENYSVSLEADYTDTTDTIDTTDITDITNIINTITDITLDTGDATKAKNTINKLDAANLNTIIKSNADYLKNISKFAKSD
jgi:light-regulated signal transduction histidine kinase (bacteriophytochrome)